MSLKLFIQILSNRAESITEKRSQRLLETAFDAKALVQLRIQEDGQNADGASFEDYTPEYKKYGRDELGYQSEYVDYTRTGEMWRSITPEIIEETDTETVVQITGRTELSKNKLRGQVAKRGNPLAISDDEIQILRDNYVERLKKDLQL